jgi:hypothetical protein
MLRIEHLNPRTAADPYKEAQKVLDASLPLSDELQLVAQTVSAESGELLPSTLEALAGPNPSDAWDGLTEKHVHSLIRLLANASTYELSVGRPEKATDLLIASRQITAGLFAEGRSVEDQIVAMSADALVDWQTRRAAGSGLLRPQDLVRLAGAVPSFKQITKGAQDGIKQDRFIWNRDGMRPIEAGVVPRHFDASELLSQIPAGHPKPLDAPRTMTMFQDIYSIALESVTMPHRRHESLARFEKQNRIDLSADARETLAARLTAIEEKKKLPLWPTAVVEEFLVMRNPIGKMAVSTEAHHLDRFIRSFYRQAASHRVQELLYAAQAYQQKHGQAASTVDEIVEAGFLKSAPVDPFTLDPLGYDGERMAAWSAGPDRVNSGGPIEDEDDAAVVPDFAWRL